MTTNVSLSSVYSLLTNLEQAALKSADAHVQAFGASMSNSLAAFKAVVPGLAATFVNAGIAELAKAEPVFGLLIPAEAIIDPVASGLAASLENMLLNSAAPGQAVPQAE